MSDAVAGSGGPQAEQERREGADDSSSSHALTGNPPASNPSADDSTGGIGAGHGGLSSTAGINEPGDGAALTGGESTVHDDGENKSTVSGLIDTFKSALGLGTAQGGAEAEAETATATAGESQSQGTRTGSGSVADQAYEYVAVAGTAVTSAAATAGATASNLVSPASSSADATSSLDPDKPAASSHDAADDPTSSSSTTTDNKNNNNTTTTADSSSSANMSEPVAEQPAAEPTTSNDGPAPGQAKEPQPTGDGPAAGNEDGKPTAKRENPDAIPTAGGERLGEKHWGESKVVPDLPPKAGEAEDGSAGVASADGQPTDEVKDNTAMNTGTATGGPGHEHAHSKDSGDKHGLIDKIKDKIHSKKD